ncbi:uncharacterized protein A4U43_C06F4250 [Asparagus officinalis]|uniref:Response regulatory domain-containing protein n=1 Tax=Asparagus officinalis TaxID=4686 RepID=A0A5P1EPZ4_ASPOF|nr:two-component response regulator ORR23-like [Asparagus officinalis]ONK66110.1 uncharacterized protein A4U43_C06F4250 [Asparagus officinalis]
MEDCMLDFFPNGLHVMIIDKDPIFLKTIQEILLSSHYKVTTCFDPNVALSLLQEKAEEFDLVVAESHMPEMSGFVLLRTVKTEFNIPVILMSDNLQRIISTKAIEQGACYFLEKPLKINVIKNIWKYVTLKDVSNKGDITMSNQQGRKRKTSRTSDHEHERPKKRKHNQVEEKEDNNYSRLKKKRVIWTSDLEEKFQDAIRLLGIDAIPSKITKFINVKGVNRDHVASHLQKYRIRKMKQEAKNLAPFLEQLNSSANPSSSTFQLQEQQQQQQQSKDNQLYRTNPWLALMLELEQSDSDPDESDNNPVFDMAYVRECLTRRGIKCNTEIPNDNLSSENIGQAVDKYTVSKETDEFDDLGEMIKELFADDDDPPAGFV